MRQNKEDHVVRRYPRMNETCSMLVRTLNGQRVEGLVKTGDISLGGCEFTVDDVLHSPYLAIGSFAEIADQIREVRRRTSMSYVGVFPTQMDAFAPVIGLLKGE